MRHVMTEKKSKLDKKNGNDKDSFIYCNKP
jgi:hypothetical protein